MTLVGYFREEALIPQLHNLFIICIINNIFSFFIIILGIFRNKIVEKNNRPHILTRVKWLDDLDWFLLFEEGSFKYNAQISRHSIGCKKRSIFWDLLY